jgi:hypothetical protein
VFEDLLEKKRSGGKVATAPVDSGQEDDLLGDLITQKRGGQQEDEGFNPWELAPVAAGVAGNIVGGLSGAALGTAVAPGAGTVAGGYSGALLAGSGAEQAVAEWLEERGLIEEAPSFMETVGYNLLGEGFGTGLRLAAKGVRGGKSAIGAVAEEAYQAGLRPVKQLDVPGGQESLESAYGAADELGVVIPASETGSKAGSLAKRLRMETTPEEFARGRRERLAPAVERIEGFIEESPMMREFGEVDPARFAREGQERLLADVDSETTTALEKLNEGLSSVYKSDGVYDLGVAARDAHRVAEPLFKKEREAMISNASDLYDEYILGSVFDTSDLMVRKVDDVVKESQRIQQHPGWDRVKGIFGDNLNRIERLHQGLYVPKAGGGYELAQSQPKALANILDEYKALVEDVAAAGKLADEQMMGGLKKKMASLVESASGDPGGLKELDKLWGDLVNIPKDIKISGDGSSLLSPNNYKEFAIVAKYAEDEARDLVLAKIAKEVQAAQGKGVKIEKIWDGLTPGQRALVEPMYGRLKGATGELNALAKRKELINKFGKGGSGILTNGTRYKQLKQVDEKLARDLVVNELAATVKKGYDVGDPGKAFRALKGKKIDSEILTDPALKDVHKDIQGVSDLIDYIWPGGNPSRLEGIGMNRGPGDVSRSVFDVVSNVARLGAQMIGAGKAARYLDHDDYTKLYNLVSDAKLPGKKKELIKRVLGKMARPIDLASHPAGRAILHGGAELLVDEDE